jgi:hypothetical protein
VEETRLVRKGEQEAGELALLVVVEDEDNLGSLKQEDDGE